MSNLTTLKGLTEVKVLCPAKVNLFLRILKKRSDGYHDIYSLLHSISLYDELALSIGGATAGIVLEADSELIPTDSRNLAYRAADLFLKRTGLRDKSIHINLKKMIPVGAGLGGGSSDCAGVLMAMDEIFGTDLGQEALMELGASLGSDVPFFILNAPAIATGRGEVLSAVTLPALYYVLINPGFSVSTEWVYNNLSLTNKDENNMLFNSDRFFANTESLVNRLKNDLEDVTCSKFPEILSLKEALMESGAEAALMSGSGPTVFGLFTVKDEALRAFALLKERFAEKDFFIFFASGL
ncbi:MAG: 4-(cytidine 5'-diphospho)-2-C-methyl-D-erythritol kinase [Thermodesulfobacteriota bacterium]